MSPKDGLQSRVLPVTQIDADLREAMFGLFSTYYDGADRAHFDRDLDEKHEVVTVWHDDALVGFTTLHWSLSAYEGREVAVLFSGDTIMDREHWGHQALASAWLQRVGHWSVKRPDCTLYWLLIVKGHRTYRYMPAFGIEFVPGWRNGPNTADLLRLRNALARDRFGSDFDARDGVVRFRSPRSRLKAEVAQPSERERRLPDVAFFLENNPGYVDGDELVCLCPLAPSNMRPYGRRIYELGRGD